MDEREARATIAIFNLNCPVILFDDDDDKSDVKGYIFIANRLSEWTKTFLVSLSFRMELLSRSRSTNDDDNNNTRQKERTRTSSPRKGGNKMKQEPPPAEMEKGLERTSSPPKRGNKMKEQPVAETVFSVASLDKTNRLTRKHWPQKMERR